MIGILQRDKRVFVQVMKDCSSKQIWPVIKENVSFNAMVYTQATHTTPEGGYFMWVELPTGTDVDQLQSKAAALGVSFVAGTDFVLTGGANTLRLAYSGVTFNEILEAIR